MKPGRLIQTIADRASDPVLLCAADATISHANPRAASLLHASADQLLGTPLSRWVLDDGVPRTLSSEGTLSHCQTRDALGQTAPAQALIQPVDSDDPSAGFAVLLSVPPCAPDLHCEPATGPAGSMPGIVEELMGHTDLDEMLRRAVELAREHIRVERCAIYLLEDDGRFRGTYGTDLQGRTVDQHHLVIDAPPEIRDLPIGDVGGRRWAVAPRQAHMLEACHPAGAQPGWHSVTPIRSSRRQLGLMITDTAISGAPVSRERQDSCAVYCSILGALIELHRAQEDRKETERRFVEMAETIPAVFWVSSPDGRTLQYVSPAFHDLTGRSAARVVNEADGWVRLMHPDDMDWVLAEISQSEDTVDLEYRIIRPDGTVRWVDTHGVTVRDDRGIAERVIGFSMDITARKSAEAALRERHEMAWALLNTTGEMAAVLASDYTILSANGELARRTKRTIDDLIGISALDHALPSYRERLKTVFDEVIETGEPRRMEEQVGTEHYVMLVNPIRDSEGRCAKLAVFIQDVTARKRAADAQRLATVGQLASGVAHEFNNLLASMLLRAERAEYKRTEAEYAKLVDLVLKAARRGADICSSLTAFARPKEIRRELVRVEKPIDAALHVAAGEIQMSGVRVRCDYQAEVRWVYADHSQLEQVFLNLVINACQAMPQGGLLSIQTSCEQTGPLGEQVVVRISDTGTGIPPEHLPHVFDPFFTTKLGAEMSSEGTGLGLSVSHGIVAAHGATIDVASEVGKGTVFEIRLTAVSREMAQNRLSSDADAPLTRKSGRIASVLICEDDEALLTLLETGLGDQGHCVRAAASVSEALRMLSEQEWSLVISDLSMPGGGGEALLQAARQQPGPTPVVIITGRTDLALKERLLEMGAAGCLHKPFTMQALAEAVQEALAEPPPGGP